MSCIRRVLHACWILPMILVTSCQELENDAGARLANTYCQSCHQLPKPGELDRTTWSQFVLPAMGNRIGMEYLQKDIYLPKSGVPSMISPAAWDTLKNYFLNNAPDAFRYQSIGAVPATQSLFGIQLIADKNQEPAFTTLVQYDSVSHSIWYGHSFESRIYKRQANSTAFSPMDSTDRGPVDIHFHDKGYDLLSMGVLAPSDLRNGTLIRCQEQQRDTIISGLQRPVQAVYHDLTDNGKDDIVICEFGFHTGNLSWYEQTDAGKFKRHVLRALPGAVHAAVADIDQDGKPDVLALMAQGDEGLFSYHNLGHGQFREERLLRFSPAFGSNYFELADINGDGFTDIVASNGDNGDYPPILKQYHGIRIYQNDGTGHFRQSGFLPMYGASKVMARDFDGDGDLDLASIAYFADYATHPEESFIYWENQGADHFKPWLLPDLPHGMWLTMDTGDFNNDGKPDLILGNANLNMGADAAGSKQKKITAEFSVVILTNKIIKGH